MKSLVKVLLSCLLSYSLTHAQVVTVPIPGSPLSLNVIANPQPLQNINSNPAATRYQLWDDGWANVPLPFNFPFFGRTFNDSTLYSNGTVQFGPYSPGNNTFCCSGITIDRSTPAAYNYSILMMQTDMYGSTGSNHYSLGTANTMTYGWYGVERLGDPANKTSFELKIDSSGGIDMRWTGAVITMNTPAIGLIGNAAQGEFAVIQQGNIGQNFSIPRLTQLTTSPVPEIVVDPCVANPLYAPTCSGYQAAYLIQQCSNNPLYSATCSGYQAAYTSQQCTSNPLYSTSCTGYRAAYFEQQCSANPLYDTGCPGYASVYLTQQCSLSALYSTTCSGYAQAYKTQQCSINALYAIDCPGYDIAYLNAKCTIDSLYSNKCEGYSTAYAIKYLTPNIDVNAVNLSLSNRAAIKVNDPPTAVASDGTISTGISATGDANTDRVISPKVASVGTSSPAAPVQLVNTATNTTATTIGQKQETKSNSTQSSSELTNQKPAPAARQELQAKREAAAKTKAVEAGKSLAAEVGKAADMEQQKQVQNLVIQAMGYTPGFDSYSNVVLQDVAGYKPTAFYNSQKTIDNRTNLRMFSGTDSLHSKMVDLQYKGK